MKYYLNIEKIEPSDIITTSVMIGSYQNACYKFADSTLQNGSDYTCFTIVSNGTEINDYKMSTSSANDFSSWFSNAKTECVVGKWYCLYFDGSKYYLYKCDCSQHSEYEHIAYKSGDVGKLQW